MSLLLDITNKNRSKEKMILQQDSYRERTVNQVPASVVGNSAFTPGPNQVQRRTGSNLLSSFRMTAGEAAIQLHARK